MLVFQSFLCLLFLCTQTENEEEKNSRKRPTTKAAIAKRMLKKSIVANTKTKFDDEGNVSWYILVKIVIGSSPPLQFSFGRYAPAVRCKIMFTCMTNMNVSTIQPMLTHN